ncbi:MAG: metallophosphoesterase [Spirochaetales bacterium]|nr:metallophosphoesterase [Spirochaetales bacterium]
MGIRIGYLTDIHLRKEVSGTSIIETRHCRKMAGLLPSALARMCRESPDMIVCTGDVLDVSTGPGVDQDLRLCKKFFDDCGTPYVVLPGNHDPLPDDFYRVFPVPEKRLLLNNCELIFFHEDACFNGEQSSKRSERSLHTMADILMRAKCCEEATLLFQHYVIYPDRNEGYPHNYQNDDEIRSILEQSDRQLLSISGHYHSGIPMMQKNNVSYFAGRAFCEKPYSCYIINASEHGIFIEELETAKEIQ